MKVEHHVSVEIPDHQISRILLAVVLVVFIIFSPDNLALLGGFL